MFLQDKVKEINKKFEKLETAESIAVWGAGIHSVKLLEKTSLLSYKVKAILDMEERKQGEPFFGYVIKNPREIDWREVDVVVISVPNKEQDIADTLKDELKYAGDIVTLYSKEERTPFYLLHSEKASTLRYIEYKTWADAEKECEGYKDDTIISKVIESIEKVRRGEAAWERDSVLFYKEKYVYQICAAILRCAVQNPHVRILDIGGSLGSTWFQNRKYLSNLSDLEWIIAEQDHFVEYGHKNLEDGTPLKFISSMEQWEKMECFDIILMSGSLQYIPKYEEIINRIKEAKPRYIILDRLMVSDRKRICIQTVPEDIYLSSYPVHIFSEDEVWSFFGADYRLIENDIASVKEQTFFTDGSAESKFYVFQCVV